MTRITGAAVVRPDSVREGVFAADWATQAAEDACRQGGIAGSDLDLIVTLSVSPSHLAVKPEHIGPRYGYIVQKRLANSKAFVLDLMDSDWTFALDQASLFASFQAFRRVLILRAECLTGVGGDFGRAFADGAAALLLDVGETPAAPRYAFLSPEPLLTMQQASGAPHDRTVMDWHGNEPASAPAIAAEFWRNPASVKVIESWAPAPDAGSWAGRPSGEAIVFEIPDALQRLRRNKADHDMTVTLISLDPFKARLGRTEVTL